MQSDFSARGNTLASGTARTRRRPARHTGDTTSVAEWLKNISPPEWIAIGACIITLVLTLQTLQAPSSEYDEGVYWQSLRALANGHALFGSVFNSQPPLFLLSVYPFYMIFGQSLSAARVAVLVFSLAGIVGAYVAGRALGHRMPGALAALLLALDPLYEHGAHTLQAELPSVALQIWAVACAALAMRASGQRQRWLAVGAGVLLGCALLIKLYAIVALVPIVLYLSMPLMRRWIDDSGHLRQLPWTVVREDLRAITPTLGLATAGLVGAVALITLPFLGQLGTAYDQVVRFHLAAAQASSHSLSSNLRIIAGALVASPLLYTVTLAVVVLVWRKLWVGVPILLWALAALVLLVRQQPLFAHHIVLLSPALAIISGSGAYAAWQAFSVLGRQRTGLMIIRIVLMLGCSAGFWLNWMQNATANAPESTRTLEMAIALRGVSAPDEVILSDDQYIAALANRDVPPQFVDTSQVRISSGYLTSAQLENYITRNQVHVILFASGRFDLLPGFHSWVAQRYTQVATFSHNGVLYLLEPSNNPPV